MRKDTISQNHTAVVVRDVRVSSMPEHRPNQLRPRTLSPQHQSDQAMQPRFAQAMLQQLNAPPTKLRSTSNTKAVGRSSPFAVRHSQRDQRRDETTTQQSVPKRSSDDNSLSVALRAASLRSIEFVRNCNGSFILPYGRSPTLSEANENRRLLTGVLSHTLRLHPYPLFGNPPRMLRR